MKRYLVMGYSCDTRAHLLKSYPNDERLMPIIDSVIEQYGVFNQEQKIQNFIDFGPISFCLMDFYSNTFIGIRDSFVLGAYYASIAGASALGELILNDLIYSLRSYYPRTTKTKDAFDKKSINSWNQALEILNEWNVLAPGVDQEFKKLESIRQKFLHFNKTTFSSMNERENALETIGYLRAILEKQYGVLNSAPWFLVATPAILGNFIKKDYEEHPFVKEKIIPNSALVGYLFKCKFGPNNVAIVRDDLTIYPDNEISDQEFCELFQKHFTRETIKLF
jgi:hypothetical protein